jgi:hypothetical protein
MPVLGVVPVLLLTPGIGALLVAPGAVLPGVGAVVVWAMAVPARSEAARANVAVFMTGIPAFDVVRHGFPASETSMFRRQVRHRLFLSDWLRV